MTELPIIPYKGLMPYAEEDAPFFFGRDAEREIVTANLMASRLTVFYGSSGVGKSSVLSAGVAYHLRQLARQNLQDYGTPEFAVVVFASWRDTPLAVLIKSVREAVTELLGTGELEPVPPSLPFAEALHAWAERAGGELYVILDQFEEYFLYHPHQEGEGTFAVEFPRAVNRPELRVNFLLSLREDALASLDRFKGRIPGLFDNILRIEHLDREAAREAIVRPIEQYNRMLLGHDPQSQLFEIEPALVDAILEQVQTGQVVLGQAGRGVGAAALSQPVGETRIETPYLQMVLNRLWDEERTAGSRTLRLTTLDRLGGASKIVCTHLDNVMKHMSNSQRVVATRVFYHLVTPSGTKIAHNAQDLAAYTERRPRQIEPVLRRLAASDVRLLRPVTASATWGEETPYEIFHDILAPAILEWCERFRRTQRLKMWLTICWIAGMTAIGVSVIFHFAGQVGGIPLCITSYLIVLVIGLYLGHNW